MDRLFTVPIDNIDFMGLLPPYFQSIKDFIYLMETEQLELGLLKIHIINIYNNIYVQTCDQRILREHERLLGIFVQPYETMEVRRLRVLNRYNNSSAVTLRSLRERIGNLLGDVDWELFIDYSGFSVTLFISLYIDPALVYEVTNMILQAIPAHFEINISRYNTHRYLRRFTNKQLSNYTNYQLRNEPIIPRPFTTADGAEFRTADNIPFMTRR